MKIPFLLLALAAATPALSQTLDAPALAKTPIVEASAPDSWQFTPDFLRDQSRISWSAPNVSGAGEFFVTLTNGAGGPTGEVVNLLSATNRNWGTVTATFDKKGKLKDQLMSGLAGAMSLGNADSKAEITLSDVSVVTSAKKGSLAERTFALKFPNMTGTLVCQYDARGRRQRDILTANGAVRTINYIYDARGLSQIVDGTTNTIIERDADGKMRSMSAMQNGLLARSATPIRGDKGAIVGTRIEDYQSGILREVNETTQQGGKSNRRTSETSSTSTTTGANGAQSTENKFEFRVNINSSTPAVAAVEVRKRTLYRNAKIASEETFRGGVRTQRSEFNDNGVISKVTNFNADGSVASEMDTSAIPYINGEMIRRENATN